MPRETFCLGVLCIATHESHCIQVLLLAALVSFLLAYFEEGSAEEGIRAYIEPFVILLILVLNAIVGVWQESNAEAALEALTQLQSEHASVFRHGKQVSNNLARSWAATRLECNLFLQSMCNVMLIDDRCYCTLCHAFVFVQIFDLPSVELVPGDLVELNVGDRVPADIRIVALKTPTLRSEQASLTGESAPANKELSAIDATDCDLLSKHNMLFSGTAVANGHCLGIVNSIGMSTEMGKIQQSIHDAAGEDDDTPLKKKLDHFGEVLAQVTAAGACLIAPPQTSLFRLW